MRDSNPNMPPGRQFDGSHRNPSSAFTLLHLLHALAALLLNPAVQSERYRVEGFLQPSQIWAKESQRQAGNEQVLGRVSKQRIRLWLTCSISSINLTSTVYTCFFAQIFFLPGRLRRQSDRKQKKNTKHTISETFQVRLCPSSLGIFFPPTI